MTRHRCQQVYDHRLRRLVHQTGDLSIALAHGVPRSTAAGWARNAPRPVISSDLFDLSEAQLQAEVLRLRCKLAKLMAVYRLVLALVRALGARLESRRITDDTRKAMLLRAVERSRAVLPLASGLRVLGLSASRYHAWKREKTDCDAEEASCPRRVPGQLTPQEVLTIKLMVTDPDYRHVPTGRLALLAQRLAKVVASPSTWHRLIRERGWRRLRQRRHPGKPKVGLRTSRPDQAWHIDTTAIGLIDGTKVYLQGVVDSFSKKILAWSLASTVSAAASAAILRDALHHSEAREAGDQTLLVVDGGSENHNSAVDEIISEGILRRVRAQSTELRFSNSPIEAFWRSLKHQWLFLHLLDSQSMVEKLVLFYVMEHNALPHTAFKGQTPNEMYTGTGDHIPDQLATAKAAARQARLEQNRNTTCEVCPRSRDQDQATEAA